MNIVAVDDSPTVLISIGAILEDLGVDPSDIYTFTSGRKALEFIRKESADIVFCDVQMPEMDGYMFAYTLINEKPEYVARLFIVSADESKECVVNMKAAGAKRFIRKPINVQYFNHFVQPELKKLAKQQNIRPTEVKQEESNFPLKIDVDVLATQIGISAKHIPKLLRGFIEEAEKNIILLGKAVEENNYQAIERLSHSFKGSAGNMKFDFLYEKSRAIEDAARKSENAFNYRETYEMIKADLNHIKKIIG